jgi:opacity protein-like surface antigen
MRKQFALGAVLAMGLGGTALAAEGISYNNVEAGYARSEIFDLADGDTFSLKGSAAFGEYLFGFAGLASTDYEGGLDTDEFNVGLGAHWSLAPNLDLTTGLSWERAKVNYSGVGSASDDGYGLSVGLRGRVADNWELSAGAKYVNLGDDVDGTTLSVGARYHFTPALALGVEISDNKDVTSYGIGFRYTFGN